MDSIFSILSSSQAANQNASDLSGRELYSKLCVVTNNEDPEGRRRVKVADPACPGLESHWLRRILDHPFYDPPLPTIGQTVLCTWAEGDNSLGFYVSIVNDTNPPFSKDDVIKDSYESTPGNLTESIGGDHTSRVSEDFELSVADSITIKNDSSSKIVLAADGEREDYAPKDITITAGVKLTIENLAGASVELLPSGAVVVKSADGTQLVLGGATAGLPGITTDCYLKLMSNATWDFNSQSLGLVNVGNFTINTKSIATIGALDTAGQALVTKGY